MPKQKDKFGKRQNQHSSPQRQDGSSRQRQDRSGRQQGRGRS